MNIEVNSESATVTVRVDATLDAQQLKQLLAQLANARGQIAQEPASPKGHSVIVLPNGAWYTELANQNGPDTMLLVLVPGFGWTGLTLPPADRVRLASFLIAQQATTMSTSSPGAEHDDAYRGEGGGSLH